MVVGIEQPPLLARRSHIGTISSFAYSVDDTGNRTRLTLSSGDYVDYLYRCLCQLFSGDVFLLHVS